MMERRTTTAVCPPYPEKSLCKALCTFAGRFSLNYTILLLDLQAVTGESVVL